MREDPRFSAKYRQHCVDSIEEIKRKIGHIEAAKRELAQVTRTPMVTSWGSQTVDNWVEDAIAQTSAYIAKLTDSMRTFQSRVRMIDEAMVDNLETVNERSD